MTTPPQPDAPRCLYCERTDREVTLIALQYHGTGWWICPQHLPLLIHKPAALEEHLPGAAAFGDAEHHHHQDG